MRGSIRRAIEPGKTLAAPRRSDLTTNVTLLAIDTAKPKRSLSITFIFLPTVMIYK